MEDNSRQQQEPLKRQGDNINDQIINKKKINDQISNVSDIPSVQSHIIPAEFQRLNFYPQQQVYMPSV